jgi:hypothetical protein
MGTNENLKPGDKVPASGLYHVIGPRGGDTGNEVTVVKGDTMPPTPKSGQTYGKPDLAHNKSGTGTRRK